MISATDIPLIMVSSMFARLFVLGNGIISYHYRYIVVVVFLERITRKIKSNAFLFITQHILCLFNRFHCKETLELWRNSDCELPVT